MDNSLLAQMGQMAAIIICIFILLFALLAVAFNLLIAFAMSWLQEKADLLKMLRPAVESVNHSSSLTTRDETSSTNHNKLIKIATALPKGMQTIEQNVEKSTNRIDSAIIEMRARTIQAKTILKTFLHL